MPDRVGGNLADQKQHVIQTGPVSAEHTRDELTS